MPISFHSLSGGSVELDDQTVNNFAEGLTGRIVTGQSSDYDDVRSIWNAMIDRKPALIAQCANTQDVTRCVNFARDNDLLSSVRGVGHNIAGNAVCNGGFMIDLSLMKSVAFNRD